VGRQPRGNGSQIWVHLQLIPMKNVKQQVSVSWFPKLTRLFQQEPTVREVQENLQSKARKVQKTSHALIFRSKMKNTLIWDN
tara:strand:- start:13 stop:258 length:246 start_codon:yes stop_codon:yes gene_type:complete